MSTLLHIDNSKSVSSIIKDIAINNKMEYLQLTKLDTILDQIKSIDFTLIIASYEIEDFSFEELYEKIKTIKENNIPIAIHSSNEDLDFRKYIYSLGISYFIPKNTTPENLNKYIEKIIYEDEINYKIHDTPIAILDDSEVALLQYKNFCRDYKINNATLMSEPDKIIENCKKYDLFIIDIILPKISGDQIIYEIRKMKPEAIIIAVSSIDNKNTIASILSSGADDFIQKPFNDIILLGKIRSSLRSLILYHKLQEKNIILEKLSQTDLLTDLFNHNYIYQRLEEEIKRKKRYNLDLTIVLFDIDHFKNINDTYGHQSGDHVLKEISAIIKDTIRNVDVAGRYGGEEFLVILAQTNLDGALILANRILERISTYNFKDIDQNITISGGVVQCSEEDSMELVKKADILLYKAKKHGRNNIQHR